MIAAAGDSEEEAPEAAEEMSDAEAAMAETTPLAELCTPYHGGVDLDLLRGLMSWLAETGAAGIVGNRADAALQRLRSQPAFADAVGATAARVADVEIDPTRFRSWLEDPRTQELVSGLAANLEATRDGNLVDVAGDSSAFLLESAVRARILSESGGEPTRRAYEELVICTVLALWYETPVNLRPLLLILRNTNELRDGQQELRTLLRQIETRLPVTDRPLPVVELGPRLTAQPRSTLQSIVEAAAKASQGKRADGWPRIADREDWGVHDAIAPVQAAGEMPRFTTYVERDHDRVIRRHLAGALGNNACSVMVVLSGDSSTGKTRAFVEAVRATEMADWPILWPQSSAHLIDELAAGIPGSCVLWLDELQEYLTGDDATEIAAALGHLLTTPTVAPFAVIATIWPREAKKLRGGRQSPYDRRQDSHGGRLQTNGPGDSFGARGDGRSDSNGQTDPFRHLVQRVKWETVCSDFRSADPADVEAASQKDPRFREAVRASSQTGQITQTLAGGRALLGAYLHQPRRGELQFTAPEVAVLDAALDLARIGYRQPIPEWAIRDAAAGYLPLGADSGSLEANWLDQSLHRVSDEWRGVRALTRVTDAGTTAYIVHDYLRMQHLHLHRDRATSAVLWDTVTNPDRLSGEIEPYVANRLGVEAYERGMYSVADRLFRAAVAAGREDAANNLAFLLREQTDPAARATLQLLARRGNDAAAQILRGNADGVAEGGGDSEVNRQLDPETVHALHVLATAGDAVVQAGESSVQASDAFLAAHMLRRFLQTTHDRAYLQTLRREADAGVDASQRILAEYLAETGTRRELAELRKRADRDDAAAQRELAELIADRGDQQSLDELHVRAVAGDSGAEYSYTRLLQTRADEQSLQRLRHLADALVRPIWAMDALVDALVAANDKQARDELRRRANAGNRKAAEALHTLLGTRCDQEWVAEIRANAANGSPADQSIFASLLRESGDDSALETLRELVNNPPSASSGQPLPFHDSWLLSSRTSRKGPFNAALAAVLSARSDDPALFQELRDRADEDGDAQQCLADLLRTRARSDANALDMLRDRRDSHARIAFADLLVDLGDPKSIQELDERADDRWDHHAQQSRAHMLVRRGDIVALNKLRELALSEDQRAGLAGLDQHYARDALADLLADRLADPLEERADPNLLEELRCLAQTDSHAREMLVAYLGTCDDDDTLDELRHLANYAVPDYLIGSRDLPTRSFRLATFAAKTALVRRLLRNPDEAALEELRSRASLGDSIAANAVHPLEAAETLASARNDVLMLFRTRATMGDAVALRHLADFLRRLANDGDEAAEDEITKLATDTGSADAHRCMIRLLVERGDNGACQRLRQLSEQGDTEAEWGLVSILGKGGPDRHASLWDMAEQGSLPARYEISNEFAARDDDEYIQKFNAFADEGHAWALEPLSAMLANRATRGDASALAELRAIADRNDTPSGVLRIYVKFLAVRDDAQSVQELRRLTHRASDGGADHLIALYEEKTGQQPLELDASAQPRPWPPTYRYALTDVVHRTCTLSTWWSARRPIRGRPSGPGPWLRRVR